MDEVQALKYIHKMAERAAELAQGASVPLGEYEKGFTSKEFAREMGYKQGYAQRLLCNLVTDGKLEVGEALRRGITGRIYHAPVYREPQGREEDGNPG